MTRLRLALAALVVALPLLAGRVPLAQAMWTAEFHDAQCFGPLCIITSPFFEVSWAEYVPPTIPATVPAQGAPSWGGPPTQGSTSAGSASP